MAGCHKNSMNIILRYLNAVSQSNVKIDTCKVSPEFEFKFKHKFLLNFLTAITFSKPALFSGEFSYKSGITEVMIWVPNLLFLEMHG